jgi:UDP-glucuronate 4-epimerase
MHALVTGVAGFIGSHLAQALLAEGHSVRGVDCFTPYYDPRAKRRNLDEVAGEPGFEFVEADLRVREPGGLLSGVDTVFHLAAQPGVRGSWAANFPEYAEHNLLATQRLLEGARNADVGRFVFGSSSSVYGDAPHYPTTEDVVPRPHSPYGATKAAAEHLCNMYADNWGIPTVSLRFFTVYGPRQRPEMAIHRLVEAGMSNQPFTLFGTGNQVRDFTFVDDAVRATIDAATADLPPGTVLNVAGGSSTTMNDLVTLVGDVLGASVRVVRVMDQPGDVDREGGSTDRATTLLGWKPLIDLRQGVEQQARWHLRRAGVRV